MNYKFTFKYPKDNDVTPTQIEYISAVMNEVERSIFDGSYPKKIDVVSFVDWVLSHDILGNNESGGTNRYLIKYDNTDRSKLEFGPLWDFDACMRNADEDAYTHNCMYFKLLFENENKFFVNLYISKWEEIKSHLLDDIISILKEYSESEEGKSLDKARRYEALRWGTPYQSISDNVDYAIWWFSNRIEWLSKRMESLKEADSVSHTYRPDSQNTNKVYDVSGKSVGKFARGGIFIKGGRKYVSK